MLGVAQGMNFGGLFLPYFLGPLAQGNMTPQWGCVLASYSPLSSCHLLCSAQSLHPVPRGNSSLETTTLHHTVPFR